MAVAATGFEQLGGLTAPKKRLKEIARDFVNPEGRRLYGIPASHFLLHGPPGTGKTSLVRALAHEINAELTAIPSSDVIDKYIGQSPQNLQRIFDAAYQKQQPQVLFFDEFEEIASVDKAKFFSAYSESQKLLRQIITDLSEEHPEIIVAAATNQDLDELDPALTRSGRLEPIAVPLPDTDDRRDIWATLILESRGRFDSEWTEDGTARTVDFVPYYNFGYYDYEQFAELSDTMTGADFKEVLDRARLARYRHYLETGEREKVSNQDILIQLKNFYRR